MSAQAFWQRYLGTLPPEHPHRYVRADAFAFAILHAWPTSWRRWSRPDESARRPACGLSSPQRVCRYRSPATSASVTRSDGTPIGDPWPQGNGTKKRRWIALVPTKSSRGRFRNSNDTYLVPLLFEPYAVDLVHRLASRAPGRVLEVSGRHRRRNSCHGVGIAERASIVATDLNQSMLDHAAALGTKRPVEWRQADAMQLPFQNGTFDALVCQFGVMFFPKNRERWPSSTVLRPGGVLIFNVWDRIEDNEFADTVTAGARLALSRGPAPISRAYTPRLSRAGGHRAGSRRRGLHGAPRDRHPHRAQPGERPRGDPAIAYCQGTPLRNEIEARDPSRLAKATDVATEAIGRGSAAARWTARCRLT